MPFKIASKKIKIKINRFCHSGWFFLFSEISRPSMNPVPLKLSPQAASRKPSISMVNHVVESEFQMSMQLRSW